MGGHSRVQGRHTIHVCIKRKREQRDGEIQRQILREGKYWIRFRSHVTHYGGFPLHDSRNLLLQTSFTTQYSSMLVCFYSYAPMGGHSRDPGRHTIYIYIYIKRERKHREGEIQRQILREWNDYIIFLQSCSTLLRISLWSGIWGYWNSNILKLLKWLNLVQYIELLNFADSIIHQIRSTYWKYWIVQ